MSPLSNIFLKDSNHGHILSVKDGICTVTGLLKSKFGEMVSIHSKYSGQKFKGLVLNLNKGNVSVMLLGNDSLVREGDTVSRTNRLLIIPTSLSFFGSVLSGIGEIISTFNTKSINITSETENKVEKKATGIIDRIPVRIPLLTGVGSVDSLIPIGRGQRELIIGDRQTGKTSIIIDTILNYIGSNSKFIEKNNELLVNDLRNVVWFVYCAIGQKQSSVANIQRLLNKKGGAWYTSIVSSTASDSAPLQFLAPYTACTVGEYIRDCIGGHSTVFFDDLSKHAVAYRQMSLLLRRPPGREAFPGDVFYVHSRLLERAGSLTKKIIEKLNLKRGTLTALPVIETQAGDVSAYIPTNVISITDGQIFLETELFHKGMRPAVNVGLSVSRVGSAAQPAILKLISGSLKIELAQFREIEGFEKFGATLDEFTQRLLFRGENIVEILKQDLHNPVDLINQVFNLFLGLGLPSKITQKLSQINSKNNLNIKLSTFTPFAMSSWLELFRVNSTGFLVEDVKMLVSNVKSFIKESHLGNFFGSISTNEVVLSLLNKCPYIFFDDIVRLFLIRDNSSSLALSYFEDIEDFYTSKNDSQQTYNLLDKYSLTIKEFNIKRTISEKENYYELDTIDYFKIASESNSSDFRSTFDGVLSADSDSSYDFGFLGTKGGSLFFTAINFIILRLVFVNLSSFSYTNINVTEQSNLTVFDIESLNNSANTSYWDFVESNFDDNETQDSVFDNISDHFSIVFEIDKLLTKFRLFNDSCAVFVGLSNQENI